MTTIPLKFIRDPAVANADSAEDAKEATGALERLVAKVGEELAALSPQANPLRRADLLLQLGRALVRLERGAEAWEAAREALSPRGASAPRSSATARAARSRSSSRARSSRSSSRDSARRR